MWLITKNILSLLSLNFELVVLLMEHNKKGECQQQIMDVKKSILSGVNTTLKAEISELMVEE